MKGAALLLVVLLAGLVAVQCSWERNKVYKYKVKAKTVITLYQPRNEPGLYYKLWLELRPHSDDVIIGRITNAVFAKENPQYDDDDRRVNHDLTGANFENLPLSKPFKINLRDGLIQSLGVDDSLSAFEINQLRLIMNQFQVGNYHRRNENSRSMETESRQMDSNESQYKSRQMDSNEFRYKSRQSAAGGRCETHYDISRIPDYLIKSHPEWVPLSEIKANHDEVVEIIKTKDSANCAERRNDLADLRNYFNNEDNVRENDLSVVEQQRIVVSGQSVDQYTIQSAVETKKLMDKRRNTPLITVSINTTLESVESTSQRPEQDMPANLKFIENLMFNFNVKVEDNKYQPPQHPRLYQPDLHSELQWTPTCWTWFMWADSACHSDFGNDWSYTGKDENCHVLGVRRQCKRNCKCETTRL